MTNNKLKVANIHDILLNKFKEVEEEGNKEELQDALSLMAFQFFLNRAENKKESYAETVEEYLNQVSALYFDFKEPLIKANETL